MRSVRVRVIIQFLHQQSQVFGRRPTASAHHRNIVLGDEFVHVVRERFGLERVNGLAVDVERQPGVGDAGDGQGGVFAQHADGLAHMLGAGGTVQADDVDAETFENGQRGIHVGAEQHAAGGVKRDLGLDGQVDAGLVEGLMDAGDGGLDFENVLRGFDQQEIDPASNQTDGLLPEYVGQFIEADVGEFGVVGGGKFARGTDGASDKPRVSPHRCPLPAVRRVYGGIFIRQTAS